MDAFLDKFFIIFHTLFALFILFGWIPKKWRKINLVLIFLTLFSWVILGIWYGFGYCPFTHWHWQVRRRMGLYDMPSSYIKFLLDKLTGWDWDVVLVDVLTITAFGSALVISLVMNIFDWKKKTT